MIQTRWVIAQLQRRWPDLEITVEQIHTIGDAVTHVPLTKIGGDGVFVAEIERALAERRVDLAVHSLKDMPTVQPAGLRLLVPGPREDARDVLITRRAPALDATPPARIGTCSLRRTAQIRVLYPQAEIFALRGNVDTRMRKLDAGDYDAIILAAAGLHRLGISADLSARMTYLPFEQVLPAPGQGALGLETRDEPELLTLLEPLNDRAIQATTGAERAFMRRLGAGCYLPVAAYATLDKGELTLHGLVTSLDGRARVHVGRRTDWRPEDGLARAELLGIEVAEVALAQGADAIIGELTNNVQEQQHV
ncbi:MAG TPA: hydroxymethylbilane synthase [Ktedonobacteraceae bacterium]